MIQKGLLIINILALILSGLAFSWVYSEHTEIAPTKNEQLYKQKLQEINKTNNIDAIKDSYVEYINSNNKILKLHNYKAEQTVTTLLIVLILLGINFVLLTILNEKNKTVPE